jgi:hypothetical protein
MEGPNRDEYCFENEECIGCEVGNNDDQVCPRCSRLEGPPPLEEVNNEEQNFKSEEILNHLRNKYGNIDVELKIAENYNIIKIMLNDILKNGGKY